MYIQSTKSVVQIGFCFTFTAHMAGLLLHSLCVPYAASQPQTMDRRTFMQSTAAGLTGISIGAVALSSTETANAEVSMGTLDMSDASTSNSDGQISNVGATVSGSWSYELPAGSVDHWLIELRVSDGDGWYTVAETSESNQYNQYSGTYEVSGSITDTEAFDVSFFAAPGPGQQTSVTLPLQVRFRVIGTNGTELANTTVSDEATVTVGQNEIDASLYGEVSGEGSVSVS